MSDFWVLGFGGLGFGIYLVVSYMGDPSINPKCYSSCYRTPRRGPGFGNSAVQSHINVAVELSEYTKCFMGLRFRVRL